MISKLTVYNIKCIFYRQKRLRYHLLLYYIFQSHKNEISSTFRNFGGKYPDSIYYSIIINPQSSL